MHLSEREIIYPVAEQIASVHDAFAIGEWLFAFKAFCIKSKIKWPPFNIVVTDFSFAILNAINYQWNRFEDLASYLKVCYEYIINKTLIQPNIILK